MFPQIMLTNATICLQTLQEELLMLVFYIYTCSEMYVYYRFPLLVGGRGEEGGGRRRVDRISLQYNDDLRILRRL